MNDEIADHADGLGLSRDGVCEFLCECGDLTCTGRVELPLAEYLLAEPGSVVAHS